MSNYSKTNEDYRRVLTTANKLEIYQSNLESEIDFLLAPLDRLNLKLCDDFSKLIFESEFKLDHFRKAEELVWKRIFHAPYRFQKTAREHLERHDEYLVMSHYVFGIGFYSSLIVKLRTHYKIYDVPGVIGPLSLSLGPIDNFVDNQSLNVGEVEDRHNSTYSYDDNCIKAKEWARQAIYRSLVYMGDLVRYLNEISQYDYHKLALELYRAASRNQPDQGLPFNQLATLVGGLNHNLNAVCNYMRCCLRPKPFEGAEGNMRKIFEFNRKFHDELKRKERITSMSEVLSSIDPSKAAESMIQMIIVTFIKLTSDLWAAMSNFGENIEKEEIIDETRLFFQSLREALDLEPIVPISTFSDQEFCPITGESSHSSMPKYISPTIMYEFCSISIMLIARYQKQIFPGAIKQLPNYIEDLVNTLALNLLHYSTSKCQKMIIRKLQELRINRKNSLVYGRADNKNILEKSFTHSRSNLSNSSHKSGDTINSITEATSRRTMSRLRKRKAATNYSDNAIRQKPSVIHAEDSDMSELEETAFSTIDALEISSDMSEGADNQMDDLIDLDSSGDDALAPKTTNGRLLIPGAGVTNSERRFLRPTRSQNYDLERSSNLPNSSNSLPIPDLLTGNVDDKINIKNLTTSQSPIDSPNESESHEKSSLSAFGKEVSQSINDVSDLDTVMAFIYTQTYLPAIKILSDWLLANAEIISSNLLSFQSFCIDLGELVFSLRDLRKMLDCKGENLVSLASDEDLCSEYDEQCSQNNMIDRHVYDGLTWIQKYPLSCDFPLFSLSILKNVHDLNIDFNYRGDLSDSESGFITIQCIEAFFHALTVFLENKASLQL